MENPESGPPRQGSSKSHSGRPSAENHSPVLGARGVTPPPSAIRKGARRYALTEKALAARRANLLKARAAPRDVIYRPTARRQAASRANIQKAIAARRTPQGNRAARLNALKHGLYTRKLAESVERLGESRVEFEAHARRFERIYVPEDELERILVRRLAETTWRRLRLFRAQARWESESLKRLFDQAPAAPKLTAEQSEARAYALIEILFDNEGLFRELMKVHSQVERALRALLRKKSNGAINFKVLSPRRESKLEDRSLTSLIGVANRIMALGSSPEGRAQLEALYERAKRGLP